MVDCSGSAPEMMPPVTSEWRDVVLCGASTMTCCCFVDACVWVNENISRAHTQVRAHTHTRTVPQLQPSGC